MAAPLSGRVDRFDVIDAPRRGCRRRGASSPNGRSAGTAAAQARSACGAARAEDAAGRRVGRARRIARQQDALRAPRAGRGAASPRAARAYRDAPGAANTAAAGPSSMMRPRYMTTTRSQRWRTTGRSWLMNSMREAELARAARPAAPGSAPGSRRRASSPARRRRGSRARWRARARCRCAGAGRRRTRAGSARAWRGSSPTCSQQLARRARLARAAGDELVDREPVGDLRADAAARIEAAIGVLEDDLHAPAQRAPLAPRERRRGGGLEAHLARGRLQQAEQQPAERALARAATRRPRRPPRRARCARSTSVTRLHRRGCAGTARRGRRSSTGRCLDQRLDASAPRSCDGLARRAARPADAARRGGPAWLHRSAGSAAVQAAMAWRQRGAKRQPGGKVVRLRHDRRECRPAAHPPSGTAASSAAV